MGYVRDTNYLEIAATDLLSAVRLPARIRRIGGGRADAVMLNTNITHTASVPRHERMVENVTVSDGIYSYRVVEIDEIIGRYRLRLQRL